MLKLLRPLIPVLVLFSLALGLRLVAWPTVFAGGGVHPPGPDALYRLRRIEWGVHHFPAVLHRDPYLNHPHGGDVIWAPGFDAALATILRIGLGPEPERRRLARVSAFVPPVLGALTVLGVFRFARRRWGSGTAWVAALLLAVHGSHVAYSGLGRVDHHVAVALATLALLAAAGALLRDSPRTRLAASSVFGFAVAAALLVWPGCILHVALLDAVLALGIVTAPDPGRARRLAWNGAWAHAVAALCLAPFGVGVVWQVWGPLSPVVLSGFQPLLLASAALLLAVAGSLAAGGPGARAALLAGLGGLALVAGGVLAPSVPGEMLDWFAKRESFQATVAESAPLLRANVRARGIELVSWLYFVLPVAAVWRGWSLRGERNALAGQALVALGCGLWLATLVQQRFANSLSVPFALLCAWLVVRALPAALPRVPVALRTTLVAAGVLAALLPSLEGHRRELGKLRATLVGETPVRSKRVARLRELERTAAWIAAHTPETAGFLDPAGEPGYGVLAHWTAGHALITIGRRPAVVTPFGDDVGPENMALVDRYFAAPEPEASEILDSLGARYVVVESRPGVPLARFGPDSMAARLYFGDGGESASSVERRAGRETPVAGAFPALVRHRLVHVAADTPWLPRRGVPLFKVWEHVRGARVEGRAPPGAPVEARLRVVPDRGRPFAWSVRTRADDDGAWRLRLPYATRAAREGTRGGPGGTRTAGAYTIASAGRTARLEVDESAVQRGGAIAGPDLSRDADADPVPSAAP